MRYQVVVYGAVFFETTDELLAYAYAHNTRDVWKNVVVREVL